MGQISLQTTLNLGAFCSLSIFRTWWLNCTFSLPVVWATFHTSFNYPLSKNVWYPLLYIVETFTVLFFLIFKFLIFILLLWDILLDFTRPCEYGRLNFSPFEIKLIDGIVFQFYWRHENWFLVCKNLRKLHDQASDVSNPHLFSRSHWE